jgi:hypothetical protein
MNSRDDAGDRGDGPDDERPRSAAIRLLGTRIVAGIVGEHDELAVRVVSDIQAISGSAETKAGNSSRLPATEDE